MKNQKLYLYIIFTIFSNFGFYEVNAIEITETLLVVHPTNYYADGESREEINRVVEKFLSEKKRVITLVETENLKKEIQHSNKSIQLEPDSSKPTYENYLHFLPQIQKTEIIVSEHGRNDIALSSPDVTIIGGYMEACLRTALRSLLKENLNRFHQIKVYIPLDAVYGKDNFLKKGSTVEKAIRASLKKEPPQKVTAQIFVNQKLILTRGNGKMTIQIHLQEPRKSNINKRTPSSTNMMF
ncbi:MAG: hypothetical protein KDD61_06205 [Bdellovibrionales bacterium]|nr:hypothetical protein [Bdellovibrionales bacterium]